MPFGRMLQGIYLMITSPLKAKFGKSHLFVISSFTKVLNWNEMVFYNFSEAQNKMSVSSLERYSIQKVSYFYLP